MRAAQQDRPDVTARREAFVAGVGALDGRCLVFVDESGVRQGMRSAYGYAPRGARCVETAPFRVGRRVNLLGWMGAGHGEVVGYDGAVTAAVFERFVAEALVPRLEPGAVVVWDNARIHSARAVALVEAAGGRVEPQPPYSPDLNAIEMLWSKVKHGVRRAQADTAEALRSALERAVGAVTARDARHWIEHCGYRFQSD